MKKWNFVARREMFLLMIMSMVLSLIYAGVSYAQAPADTSYVTMSQRIGAFIVLFRAFDVFIYFFQGVLLFIGVGFTIYYLQKFHKESFLNEMRRKLHTLSAEVSPQEAIEFEITGLSNRFLFLEMMIAAAPVSGLLGTVVGLVQVFSEQTLVQKITMQTIAGGMYVAMVTTVCGLIVALIGIIGRHLLNTRLAEMRESLAGAD
jgi:biopolymer transport protein ExbB/TolQ